MQKVIDLDEILCSGVVEVADYEFKIQKFNMADPIWLTKMQGYLIWTKFCTRTYSKVYG